MDERIEPKVNEIIEIDGVRLHCLKVKDGSPGLHCSLCDLAYREDDSICDQLRCLNIGENRDAVIFKIIK